MFQSHAEIEYRSTGAEDHHYFLRDLGSNNGTFVNSVRLSEARQPSKQVEVSAVEVARHLMSFWMILSDFSLWTGTVASFSFSFFAALDPCSFTYALNILDLSFTYNLNWERHPPNC